MQSQLDVGTRWGVVAGVGGLMLLGVACGGSGDSPGVGNRGVQTYAPVGSGGATAGAGGAAGGGGTGGGFGNSTTPVSEITPADASVGSADAGPAPDEPTDCGGVEVQPTVVMEVVPGDVLVIFDESLSMNDAWSSGGSKWSVATQAVTGALTPLQDQINAATLFFPNAGIDGCGVSAIDSGTQIDFMPGPQFLTAWSQYLSSHGPGGFTPTGTAMQMADTALTSAALVGTTAVVVITDGDPNCGTNDTQVNQLAAKWLQQGIETHVIGLPGANAGANRLNALAAAGGTTQYLTPSDASALQTALADIVGSSVSSSIDSCRIALPYAPPNPDDVTLAVVQDGVKQAVARDLGASGGWSLDLDSLEITLDGALCDQAKLGTYSSISAVFGCAELPPLPPPPSPM